MNIRDLARLAGVSPSTVSKVINGKDDSISAATRERVLNLVKEYNYQAYSAAMDSGSKSFILGVLLKSFEQCAAYGLFHHSAIQRRRSGAGGEEPCHSHVSSY